MPQCQPEKSGRTRASTASSSTLVDAAVFMRAPLTLILIYIAAAVTAPKTKSRARRGEGEGGFRSRSPSPNHHPHLLSALHCVSISPVQGVSSHLTPCYVRLPTFIMAKSMVRFNMTKPIHVHARLEPTEQQWRRRQSCKSPPLHCRRDDNLPCSKYRCRRRHYHRGLNQSVSHRPFLRVFSK